MVFIHCKINNKSPILEILWYRFCLVSFVSKFFLGFFFIRRVIAMQKNVIKLVWQFFLYLIWQTNMKTLYGKN